MKFFGVSFDFLIFCSARDAVAAREGVLSKATGMLADMGSGWEGSVMLYAGITGMYQYILPQAAIKQNIGATAVQYSISYKTIPNIFLLGLCAVCLTGGVCCCILNQVAKGHIGYEIYLSGNISQMTNDIISDCSGCRPDCGFFGRRHCPEGFEIWVVYAEGIWTGQFTVLHCIILVIPNSVIPNLES